MFVNETVLTLKKKLRPAFWRMLDFYDRVFSKRGKRVNEFNRMLSQNDVFFTVNVNTEGFTDQLTRFIFFYKIGTSLGLNYTYTSLHSSRSNIAFTGPHQTNRKLSDSYSDIYDFLGLNTCLKRLSSDNDAISLAFNDIIINFDELKYEKRNIKSLPDFLFYLKSELMPRMRGKKYIRICFKGSPGVFSLYSLIGGIDDRSLDFRKVYIEERKENPWESSFSEGKIKLMIHIRQGDTAIIKTPWNTFIPVWYTLENPFQEVKSSEDIEDFEVVDISLYTRFLRDLFNHFTIENFSPVVFSDGYKKAFSMVEKEPIFKTFSESK